ncbi:aminopeptidase P N-terminal domain-containing protein [Catalinimonas niigatensis]|uniref:aminopeptidase P N-terminal domain-containing protein n=1 Tax=Catalinimonas niigatensis TaxID=1397264 RepID=UPI00266582BE|nr:aminopeptidase P N-terminal domain-containing protein [Catalinimonas niigatensis]WPP49336.1 aminopeptidase P N-terminal domain-containing protein [Catalinimonas niigatensis]
MKKNILIFCLLYAVCLAEFCFAQAPTHPDDFLPMDFHQSRREALRAKMPPNSVAVLFSNPVRNRANDVDYMYHQDPNFYYLTGHREPHSVLLIFKDEQRMNGKTFDETIFVRGHDALKELYDGERLGKEGAQEKLEMEVAFVGADFKDYNIDFSKFDKVMFYDFKNDVRDTKEKADLYELIASFKEKINYPDTKELTIEVEPQQNNLDTKTLDSLLSQLRGIKTAEELDLMRKAVNISALGQAEVMKAMRPGMSELEVQGMHEFIYKKYQAEYEGYPSIVGAGHNGCVLHYIENYKPKIEDGELILMDLGAEYHGYTADVTRTIPVNGKFTKEQKIIYDLVYEAQEAAMAICKEGTTFKEIYAATAKVINEGLVELGIYASLEKEDIINPATGRNRYYPHGCTHHIGLDVHDLGEYDTLQAGMVITIEPGIYIPEGSPCDPKWWNIPVRIEDDFLITKDGYELLSDLAPRKAEEIEVLMEEPSPFDAIDLPKLE